MTHIAAPSIHAAEPLVRLSDLEEYQQGLDRRLSGQWDDEVFTGFRTRFGVYGQKQPGVQMIRIKIPGGILHTPWLRSLAAYNRAFCQGDLHITTRQDVQSYFVPLERSAEALEFLYRAGLTTREACGNTFRNVTSCALAGSCPRERVDAGAVADRLARSWIRQPLVQQMPRKVKIAVSGCATDCGASSIHDLAFIAVEQDGRPGFRVLAGGGLGGQPRPAVEVLPFVTEEALPTVVEATARLHQRYSDRVNRNAARLKFLLKRFGEEKFVALFREEYQRLLGLAQRPWQPLEWRRPQEAAIESTPVGVVRQHDGRFAVVGNPPLGILSSEQMEALADLAEAYDVAALRATRDQTLVVPDLPETAVVDVVARLRALNIAVAEQAADNVDVVSCPGTTTCRIGITSSYNFARAVVEDAKSDPSARGVSVRVSGCQNSCGLHHVGDFGFHGMAKKIDGQSAPHYQIHLGGDAHAGGQIGLSGPIVPARHGVEALRLLRTGYATGKQTGESVRAWAERLGKPGLAALLQPLEALEAEGLHIDWGDDQAFAGAPTLKGECAVPLASDPLLASLADDHLIQLDRLLLADRWQEALQAGESALVQAGRRILHRQGQATGDDDAPATIFSWLREKAPALVVEAHGRSEDTRIAALSSGRAEAYREAVASFLDVVRALVDGVPAEEEA